MKIKMLLIVGLVLCLAAPAALADPLTVVGSGAWQDFTAGNINQNGKPYWDNPSLDTGDRNVGYFLTGSGAVFGADTNYLGTGPQFWGMAYSSGNDGATNSGAADTSFTATTTLPYSWNQFLLRITGFAGTDTVGIYDTTDTTNKTVLFGPSDSVGDTKLITLPASFGFYGISGDGNTYYSDSALNPLAEQSHQHFAFFQDKNNIGCYFLGFEDLAGIAGTEGTGDFNDIVVEFCPVPLPGALLLLGGGFVRLLAYGRRRRESVA